MKRYNSSAIVLAAGYSDRMGTPKFDLKLDSGNSFLEHIIEKYYSFGCEHIVVVINQGGYEHLDKNPSKLPANVKIVINHHPQYERFYSLQCGCRALLNSKPVFFHNVDNPVVDHEVLTSLMKHIEGVDYVKPVYKGQGGHPVLFCENLLQAISKEPANNINLREFLLKFRGKGIEVANSGILLNINTIKDYRNFQSGLLP